jgi:hypothetical protein
MMSATKQSFLTDNAPSVLQKALDATVVVNKSLEIEEWKELNAPNYRLRADEEYQPV